MFLENIAEQNHKDVELQAKLHGMRVKSGLKIQKWTREEDSRMKKVMEKRFEKMEAEAEIKKANK